MLSLVARGDIHRGAALVLRDVVRHVRCATLGVMDLALIHQICLERGHIVLACVGKGRADLNLVSCITDVTPVTLERYLSSRARRIKIDLKLRQFPYK